MALKIIYHKISNRSGFTLVEILISIGVILILAILIAGSAAWMRVRAASVGCLSNLRQIHMAMMSYASENSGCLPYSTDDEDGNASWMHALYTGGYLPPFPMDSQLATAKHPLIDPGGRRKPRSPTSGNYAINSDLVARHKPKGTSRTRIASIKNPSKKIFIFCGGLYDLKFNYVKTPQTPFYYLPGATINASVLWSEQFSVDALEGRHEKKVNALFLGGNAETYRPDDLINQTEIWKK